MGTPGNKKVLTALEKVESAGISRHAAAHEEYLLCFINE